MGKHLIDLTDSPGDDHEFYDVAGVDDLIGAVNARIDDLPEPDDGEPGDDGDPGKSTYELAVEGGFVGSVAEWLASLKGEPGADGDDGDPGDDGEPGMSAFEVAQAEGWTGSQTAWLASLHGSDGDDSTVPGPPGKSAYQIALDNGFSGSQTAWLASLVGPAGPAGGGAPPFLVVASVDAPAAVKALAGAAYTCDGVNDEAQINAALNAATGPGNPGHVVLSAGKFVLGSSILLRTGVWLQGSGDFTELRASSGLTAATGAGSQVAMIKCFDVNTHKTVTSDLMLNGWAGSGGPGHGINLESASSGDDHTAPPATSPDPSHTLRNLYVYNFIGAAGRTGILLANDLRGSWLHEILIRACSGNGLELNSAPDCHLTDITVGTQGVVGSGVNGTGFKIGTGNAKVVSCKAFYCETWGFDITSGRGALSACEVQDCVNGFRFAGANQVASSIVADTCRDVSVQLEANHMNLGPISVFNRGNGRYPQTDVGVKFASSIVNSHVNAVVAPTQVTTKVQAISPIVWTHAANEISISDGTSLIHHP